MKKNWLRAGVGLGGALTVLSAPLAWGLGLFVGAALAASCYHELRVITCPARGCPGPEMDYTGRCVTGCGCGRPDESCPAAP